MNISDFVMEQADLDPQHEPPFLFPANRWTFLPALFDAFGFRVGAEIGVGGGRFSRHLCETVANLKLYAIDPWQCYGHYESRYNQKDFERSYRKAKEVLSGVNCTIVREFSHIVAPKVRDGALDFIHLDANEDYEHVVQDLDLWAPKVRTGGVISGLCYYNFRDHSYCQVKDAVDWWTVANGIDPWFVAVHARYPCWFWEVR